MNEEQAHAFVRARCDAAAYERLRRFEIMLRDEASRQNLISASTLASVWARHFVDSAQIVDHVRSAKPDLTVVDLGSGAGLPGLVLAIMRPRWRLVLVESRKLRIKWLSTSAAELNCDNVTVEGRNVSQVAALQADVITARAFAPMSRLLDLSARFSTPLTEWVLPKGRSAAQEVAELPHGLHGMFHVEQSLSDPSAGVIVGRGKVGTHR